MDDDHTRVLPNLHEAQRLQAEKAECKLQMSGR